MAEFFLSKAYQYEKIILNIIKDYNCVSRSVINKITDIRPTTITNITRKLLEDGQIIEAVDAIDIEIENDIAKKNLLINKNYRLIIGVDINFPMITSVLSDFSGNILKSYSNEIRSYSSKEVILDNVFEAIDEMLADQDSKMFLGIGVVSTGMIDHKTNTIVFSSLLSNWNSVKLKDILENKYNLKVYLEDRVASFLYAEKWFGKLTGKYCVAYIDMGDIFGAGFMFYDKILINPCTSFGEIGHFKVASNGNICTCGNRGCLQTVASSHIILDNIKNALKNGTVSVLIQKWKEKPDALNIFDVLSAAETGDRISFTILMEAAEYIGKAISYVINIFGPDQIIFGGPLVEESEFLMNAVMEEAKKSSLSAMINNIECRRNTFGKNSGIMGAVCIVLDKYFEIPNL